MFIIPTVFYGFSCENVLINPYNTTYCTFFPPRNSFYKYFLIRPSTPSFKYLMVSSIEQVCGRPAYRRSIRLRTTCKLVFLIIVSLSKYFQLFRAQNLVRKCSIHLLQTNWQTGTRTKKMNNMSLGNINYNMRNTYLTMINNHTKKSKSHYEIRRKYFSEKWTIIIDCNIFQCMKRRT